MNPKAGSWTRGLAFSVGLALSAGCSSCNIPQSDTVARIADPSSPHKMDYVDYPDGHSKPQAMDRLPHIALIGDSLSRNFYVSSVRSMLWRSKMDHGRDWFLDTDPAPGGINSVYQRIDQITPVVAVEYASPGGIVDSDVKQTS